MTAFKKISQKAKENPSKNGNKTKRENQSKVMKNDIERIRNGKTD